MGEGAKGAETSTYPGGKTIGFAVVVGVCVSMFLAFIAFVMCFMSLTSRIARLEDDLEYTEWHRASYEKRYRAERNRVSDCEDELYRLRMKRSSER